MGKNVIRLLKFAIQYPGWNPYGKDRSTVDAIKTLERLDLVRTNDQRQYQVALPAPPAERPIVTHIEDNVVKHMRICENKQAGETLFMLWAREYVPNWTYRTEDEMSAALEDGYVETPKGTVCLTWTDSRPYYPTDKI